jgi:hypothetical protein
MLCQARTTLMMLWMTLGLAVAVITKMRMMLLPPPTPAA